MQGEIQMMVTTNLVGTNASFNNICLTPTPAGNVPMLYPNNVITTTSVPAATHVFTGCGIAMNMNGQAPVSLGDMPGLGMGIMSGTIAMAQRYIMGCVTVLLSGTPFVNWTKMTTHNNNNAIGCNVAPSPGRFWILQ